MAKKGVIMYYDLLEQLQDFSDESFGKIARAMIEYDKNGTLPNFEGELKIAFKFIKLSIDRNKEEYEQKCEKNRDNALKRWNANGCERIQTDAINADTDKDNDIDKDIDKDNDNNKNKEETINDLILGSPIELRDNLKEFLKMRKTIKKPMTTRAFKLLLTRLTKLSNNSQTQNAILEQSILNSWQDIYPLKKENQEPLKKSQELNPDEYEDVSIGYIDKYGITVYASYPRKKGQTEWTEEERAKILKEVEGVKFLW